MYPRLFAAAEFSSRRAWRAAGNDARDDLSCARSSRSAGSCAIACRVFCERGWAVVEVCAELVRKAKGEDGLLWSELAVRDCSWASMAALRASSAFNIAFNFADSCVLRRWSCSSSGVIVVVFVSRLRWR